MPLRASGAGPGVSTTAPRARALLLDLDGTLLDTAPDMAGALNSLRVEEGRVPLPFAALRPFVSHGAVALVRAGFGDVDEAEPPGRAEQSGRRGQLFLRSATHESFM